MKLSDLQKLLPWTIKYHRDFRNSPVKHKDFQHAAVHVAKALGAIFSAINDAEHAGFDWESSDIPLRVADLVICALRMANTMPDLMFSLEEQVIKRLEAKNGVKFSYDGRFGKWICLPADPGSVLLEVNKDSVKINDTELGDVHR